MKNAPSRRRSSGRCAAAPLVLRRLLRIVRVLAMRDPARATTAARTAAFCAGALIRRAGASSPALAFVRADALREAAATLSRCGRFGDAERAAFRARRIFALPAVAPLVTNEGGRLDMTIGYVLFCLGRTQDAFEALDRAGKFLLRRLDVSGYVKARTTEAALRIHLEQYAPALEILESAVANITDDLVKDGTFAAIGYNAAICAVSLGDERAEQCYAEAVSRLERAGMYAELVRTRTLKAKELRRKGKREEAFAEYERARAGFDSRKMPGWAAAVTVEMARLHLEDGDRDRAAQEAEAALPVLVAERFERDALAAREILASCAASA